MPSSADKKKLLISCGEFFFVGGGYRFVLKEKKKKKKAAIGIVMIFFKYRAVTLIFCGGNLDLKFSFSRIFFWSEGKKSTTSVGYDFFLKAPPYQRRLM